MTTLEEINRLASQLSQEQQQLIVQLIYNMIAADEPDEWEKKVIKEWESMSYEERMDGAKTHEELIRELGLDE